jgi:hypothetical protein
MILPLVCFKPPDARISPACGLAMSATPNISFATKPRLKFRAVAGRVQILVGPLFLWQNQLL